MRVLLLIAASIGLLAPFSGAQPSAPPPTGVNLAVVATPSSSYVSGDTRESALNDGSNPRSSRGDRRGTYGNWPREGTQWVQYATKRAEKSTNQKSPPNAKRSAAAKKAWKTIHRNRAKSAAVPSGLQRTAERDSRD
jgi:hypothetical protein